MVREPALKIMAVGSTKGGVGKTTLASALAVQAAAEGKRVALIDADPQGSLTFWHRLRDSSSPDVIDVDPTPEAIGLIASTGYDWLIIDTPPAILSHIIEAIDIADFVLVPMRPSALDIQAVSTIKDICEDQEKPFGFVLNQVEPDGKITALTRKLVSEDFGHVLKSEVSYRPQYIKAMTRGKTGPELARSTVCTREIDELWSEVKGLVNKAIRGRANVTR